jgi:hypothetical protein
MRQVDVVMAFLCAGLFEEVYMYPPPGINIGTSSDGKKKVFRLLKALYGLMQSPFKWYGKIGAWLADTEKLQRSSYDRCVYYR